MQSMGYSARKLLEEFLDKDWSCSALDRLLWQIDATGSADKKSGSSRERTVWTPIPTQRHLRHLSPASLMTQMGRNAAAGLPCSWHLWTKAALNWCLACFEQSVISMRKYEILSISIQLRIMHILFCLSYLLILWTLNKSYCVTCSRILPLSIFCVLQVWRDIWHQFCCKFHGQYDCEKNVKIGQHVSNLWTNV